MKTQQTLLFLALTVPLTLLATASDPQTAQVEPPAEVDTSLIGQMPPAREITPEANAAHTTTSKLVYGLLSDSRYAYRPRALDDALSQTVFEDYFESLDGSKLYFTAQDLQNLGLDPRYVGWRLTTTYNLPDAARGGPLVARR